MSSRQERLLTYVAIPLMPCSARLPVYALLIAILIPNETALGGLIGWQGLAMSGIYFFGIMTALIVAASVSRMGHTGSSNQAFILELPSYRLPELRPILSKSLNRAVHFIKKAGSVIFVVTVVVWFLGYFPNGGEDLSSSWLAALGRFIEPVFSPLGLDWRYGVAIIASFLAREVFVGTLGTIFGIESADEDPASLADQIAASGLTAASGLALVVFFTIALQCVSTVALLARRSKVITVRAEITDGLFGIGLDHCLACLFVSQCTSHLGLACYLVSGLLIELKFREQEFRGELKCERVVMLAQGLYALTNLLLQTLCILEFDAIWQIHRKRKIGVLDLPINLAQ